MSDPTYRRRVERVGPVAPGNGSLEFGGEERTRFLVEELGISEMIAAKVPRDRGVPPRP